MGSAIGAVRGSTAPTAAGARNSLDSASSAVRRSAPAHALAAAGARAVGAGGQNGDGRDDAGMWQQAGRTGTARPASGLRRQLARLDSLAEPALHRRYLPAPPPVSIRTPDAAPLVPAVARTSSLAPSPAPGGVSGLPASGSAAEYARSNGRSSLVQATAELFRSVASGQPTIRRLVDGTGGQSMGAPSGYDNPYVPELMGADGYQPDSVQPKAIPNQELERIVDKVVEKIEQRVIDELERRGRRHTPGVF
ncbi:MAG: hypothetical protein ABI232_02685 [Jatrophihabitantaceae bacterium]